MEPMHVIIIWTKNLWLERIWLLERTYHYYYNKCIEILKQYKIIYYHTYNIFVSSHSSEKLLLVKDDDQYKDPHLVKMQRIGHIRVLSPRGKKLHYICSHQCSEIIGEGEGKIIIVIARCRRQIDWSSLSWYKMPTVHMNSQHSWPCVKTLVNPTWTEWVIGIKSVYEQRGGNGSGRISRSTRRWIWS